MHFCTLKYLTHFTFLNFDQLILNKNH